MSDTERLKRENEACEKLILSMMGMRLTFTLPLSQGRGIEISYPRDITESELALVDRGLRLFRDSLHVAEAPFREAMTAWIQAKLDGQASGLGTSSKEDLDVAHPAAAVELKEPKP